MPIIISADQIKKEFPNYDPTKVELFHRVSTKKADKMFEQALKSSSYDEVILLSGGTAAGKTEFVKSQLNYKKCIVLDTTLPTPLGAKIKIKKIHKANKKAVVYSIIPANLTRSFVAFLNRERKFGDEHFYRTHIGSRKTLLWVANNYENVEINVIKSFYDKKQIMRFNKIKFVNRQKLIKYLVEMQLDKFDIMNLVRKVKLSL